MLEFDTPFRAKVRTLQAPNSSNFDPATWATLLKTGNPSSSDLALAMTAVWVADQAAKFREHVSESHSPQLDARTAVLLAVAMLNREHSVISEKLRKAQIKASAVGTPMSMDPHTVLPL